MSVALNAAEYRWQLPPGFPEPQVPANNPMSEKKVELGRRLFYENRLSLNGQYNCASCHVQKYAFAEPRVTAVGASGELHKRNSMSLTNVAYNASYTWADSEVTSLEAQIHIPLFNERPVELGLTGREDEFIAVLSRDSGYTKLFAAAFPEQVSAVNLDNVIYSIAAFVRTLLSGNSAYDRLLYLDEQSALSVSARRGMRLFFSGKLKCAQCHSGFNFSGPVMYKNATLSEPVFHDNGLPVTDDKGLYLVSGQSIDLGKFRAPTLRNIAVSAPYMHDGRFGTLDEVIEHYASAGSATQNRSELITGFKISETEKQDLKHFLESLTDESFVSNKRFSNNRK